MADKKTDKPAEQLEFTPAPNAPALNREINDQAGEPQGQGPGPNPALSESVRDHADRATNPATTQAPIRQDNAETQPAPVATGQQIITPVVALPPSPDQVQTAPVSPELANQTGTIANLGSGGLALLARMAYGNGGREFRQFIFEANRDVLVSPDAFQVGQPVRVPPLSDELRAKAESLAGAEQD